LSIGTVSAMATSKTLDMALVGVGGANAGGVYTYPYYLTVDGGPQIAMVCDSFDDQVGIPDVFKATESGLLSGHGKFSSRPNAMLDYKAAGLLFLNILANPNNTNLTEEDNFAIWGLFSSNARNNSFFISSGAGSLDAQYLALAKTAPNSEFNGIVLYTPVSGSHQEYIGYSPGFAATPEPGTMALMGTGLLSCAGMFRRKLRKG